LAASRFLRFLEPEEENALLAAASPRSFERNEVVLDQDVPLRTIYLIEEGSVRVERQGRERSTLPGDPWSGRILWRNVVPGLRTLKRQGSCRRASPHPRDRRANRREQGAQRRFLCWPPLPIDRRNSCRAASPHVNAPFDRPVLELTRQYASAPDRPSHPLLPAWSHTAMPTEAAPKEPASAAQAERIMATFSRGGYQQIAMAVIQPAGPLLDSVGEALRARTHVLVDRDGQELCLRPDLTIPPAGCIWPPSRRQQVSPLLLPWSGLSVSA